MSGEVELMQYSVKNWIIEESPSGVVVTLVLGRKILNELLTTYLPTSLLIIIVHTTNYFKDFFFEAIVTVNLTGPSFLLSGYTIIKHIFQACWCCPPCLSACPAACLSPVISRWSKFGWSLVFLCLLLRFCYRLVETLLNECKSNSNWIGIFTFM